MKIKYLVYTLLIAGVGALVFYRISENKKQKTEASGGGGSKDGKKPPMAVNGVVVTPQEFANTLSLSGSIDADEQIEVRTEVSGIAEKIFFTEGAKVSKGQVLVKINDIELRAQAGQAKTRQTLAAENERRAKLLLQKEAISQEEYDIASADFKTAQAQTQLINAQIAKTSIRAPFAGTIGLRNISPGTYVTPETLITTLVSSNKIKITFSIPEKYAAQMKVDSRISFTVAGSGEKFEAKVYALEPAVEVSTRTLRVRAMADNAKGKLLPGTFANVILPLDMVKDAFVIPTEAIVPVQDGKKVFVSKNGQAQEIMVETGTRTDKDIVVLSGLKAGDTVLTTGVLTLKKETPVKVSVTQKAK
ncbi:efflux RND transporter periplasmic adaptor subunit [Flavobacterium sp. DG1-102-2]|uniref:efflux RND transporter periplasmic adaptor subunit n=1 Tax=Flavobacterium sp. DG1-102-2 TaxID=3081663 RepID=UPI002949A2C9|nr:efflux RND transporter periplasmic adaptor subunit [Flavobacterium sp. DG1-102-2]MDV6168860.1 efflux RND transporter periplasmic adaptor subunit [Flavobacterium sp. DG1-102-2]